MRHPYNDITDEITRLIRAGHETHAQGWGDFPAGCVLAGKSSGECTCVAKPLWWDQHGVPRFLPHTPLLCPDIGATEVILLQIACQNCAREFPVQMSWSMTAALRLHASIPEIVRAAARSIGIHSDPADAVKTSLAYQIAGKGPHYGDPPHHERCVGNTMNVWDLRVLEFWRRKEASIEYVRLHELEVPLPDLTCTDRVGPS